MADNYARRVADALIEQLRQGTAPWQQPWQPGQQFLPYNPTTGKTYRGANAMWLLATGQQKGYADPRWMTYKQAQGMDAQVRKGEKGTVIQYWTWQGEESVRGDDGRPVLGTDGKVAKRTVDYERPRVFSAVVFNAAQIDNLQPAPERTAAPAWERHVRAEAILTNSGAAIRHVYGGNASYNPVSDRITLPERAQFPGADRYYATALHELGHWTGHESRLARDLAHPFGSEGYAREELRAEIASLMVGGQLGIGHDIGQHAAYVDSWIEALQHDPREVFRAAADAEKIAAMVQSFDRTLDQASEQAVEQARDRATDGRPPRGHGETSPVSEPTAVVAAPVADVDDVLAQFVVHVLDEASAILGDAVPNIAQHSEAWLAQVRTHFGTDATTPERLYGGVIGGVGYDVTAALTERLQQWTSAAAQGTWSRPTRGPDVAIDSPRPGAPVALPPSLATAVLSDLDRHLESVGAELAVAHPELHAAGREFETLVHERFEKYAGGLVTRLREHAEPWLARTVNRARDPIPDPPLSPALDAALSRHIGDAVNDGDALTSARHPDLPFASEAWMAKWETRATPDTPDTEAVYRQAAHLIVRNAGAHLYLRLRDWQEAAAEHGAWAQSPRPDEQWLALKGSAWAEVSDAFDRRLGQLGAEVTAEHPDLRPGDPVFSRLIEERAGSYQQALTTRLVEHAERWIARETGQAREASPERTSEPVLHAPDTQRTTMPPSAPNMDHPVEAAPGRARERASDRGAPPTPTPVRPAPPTVPVARLVREATSSESRTYLAVPYAEKDQAKALGARWDREARSWYAPPGADLARLAPWRPDHQAHVRSVTPVARDPHAEFADALSDAGLRLEGAPAMDGQLHRVPVEGDKPGAKSGGYVGFVDGHPAGYINNYRTGFEQTWKSQQPASTVAAVDRARLAAEAAEHRQARAAARAERAEATAATVGAYWNAATPLGTHATSSHPYLDAKGVGRWGELRVSSVAPLTLPAPDQDGAAQQWSGPGQLLVPAHDVDGTLRSVQSIDAQGRKSFPRGGQVTGAFAMLNAEWLDPSARELPMIVVEGYATGATLAAETRAPVAVAFHAGNLEPVARALHARYPDRSLIVAGDDDHHRPRERGPDGRPKPNVGREKAESAAASVGGVAIFPRFAPEDRGTDWNDLRQEKGAAEFLHQFRGAMASADRQQLAATRGSAAPGREPTLAAPEVVLGKPAERIQQREAHTLGDRDTRQVARRPARRH